MKKCNIILFGGDRLNENRPLTSLASFLKSKKIEFIIFTDPIHLKKKINKYETFEKSLKKKNYKFVSLKKLKSKNVKKYISSKTFGISLNSIWKFDKRIINLFKGKLYNYHAADLPTERGAANISWRILLNKKNNSSINIHSVDQYFDTGPILKKKQIFIKKTDILPQDHLKKIELKEKIFLQNFVIEYINGKKFMKKKQNNNLSYYWPRLNSDKHGLIDWNWTAKEIIDFIRAFSKPYNGAYTYLNGKKIRIYNAKYKKTKTKFHPFQNGIIFRIEKQRFHVASKKYEIIIEKKDTKNFGSNIKRYVGKKFLNE